MMIRVRMRMAFNGSTITLSIWEQRDSRPTPGLALKTRSNCSRNRGYRYASWNASVGKITWRLLLSSKSREQKKLAPSFPSAKLISANVWAMVDFPVPARPFSQNTRWSCSSFNQCSSYKRTSPLVPLRHPCLFPERYPASSVRDIPFRRWRSASPYSQVTTIGQIIKERYSLSVDSSRRRSLVVTKSEVNVRHDEGESFESADPIAYQGITNVFHQTVKLL